ncbi:MAG: carbon-nitrogen hydrolase family protein [Alphaproteobacteria bacterium]|nr:carbon-nitrogen hydrolase family protein [Alphaproteobacteria bacterium]
MAVLRAACVQVNAGTDMAANIAAALGFIRQAKDRGAQFVLLPENVAMLGARGKEVWDRAAEEDHHPALAAFRDAARALDLWLLAGSLSVRVAGETRVANRSLLLRPDGSIAGRYDKIHMFDVQLPNGEVYRESQNYRPGDLAVLAETPWGLLGMTVCYDLRFPQFYRGLAQAGASLIAIPSAFTQVTGEAHWHVLMRARAIENGAFVLAPAQCGAHAGNRRTFGHSLIVAPWGEVLADGGTEPGVTIADLDLDLIAKARAQIPSLQHDRPYRPPAALPRAAE